MFIMAQNGVRGHTPWQKLNEFFILNFSNFASAMILVSSEAAGTELTPQLAGTALVLNVVTGC